MTRNRPQRPNRSPRHPRSRNPNDPHSQRRNDASAAGLTGADRDEAAPPRQRRRSPAEPRPRQPRPRVVTLAGVVLALALIGGVVFAGIHLVRTRHSAPSPTAAKPTGLPTHATTPTATPPPLACGVPASLLTTMPKRDKLAQLLMVGVTDAADARRVVTTDHVGGIFIASWTDLSMLRNGELTAIAHSASPLGLAVSVDEEGGRVERLSSLIGSAPSARVLAQNETPEQVYELARDHGQKMRNLGITIDFAPVVDVTNAPDDTVIGDRSFSADPAKVTEYAGAYAKGLRDAGVLPVLKHFPGHGRASGDSHTSGVVDPPLGELKTLDLVPYRTLATTQPPVGVMIGHMVVPGLTDGSPASLSRAAVNLLRTGTGYDGPRFDGPVFTDDLSTMKAITNIYNVPEAVLKALQAGADTALWVTNTEVPAVLDRLEAAVDHHELSMANVDASVRRMATVKAMNRCGH
jgi:beta-N-acetylhexosaminidase